MNSFLLTVSGVLFLLTCGLSMPSNTAIPTDIIDALRTDVTCDNKVTLFVPLLENTNLSAAATCFQKQLDTIASNCTCKNSTVIHAKSPLKTIRGKKDVPCIFAVYETVSYSSFLEKFKELIQQYNSKMNFHYVSR